MWERGGDAAAFSRRFIIIGRVKVEGGRGGASAPSRQNAEPLTLRPASVRARAFGRWAARSAAGAEKNRGQERAERSQ